MWMTFGSGFILLIKRLSRFQKLLGEGRVTGGLQSRPPGVRRGGPGPRAQLQKQEHHGEWGVGIGWAADPACSPTANPVRSLDHVLFLLHFGKGGHLVLEQVQVSWAALLDNVEGWAGCTLVSSHCSPVVRMRTPTQAVPRPAHPQAGRRLALPGRISASSRSWHPCDKCSASSLSPLGEQGCERCPPACVRTPSPTPEDGGNGGHIPRMSSKVACSWSWDRHRPHLNQSPSQAAPPPDTGGHGGGWVGTHVEDGDDGGVVPADDGGDVLSFGHL